jgi:hypothetical protein
MIPLRPLFNTDAEILSLYPPLIFRFHSIKLAGANGEAIATDYALTRIGREPARQMVMARLAKEPIFAENSEAALNMFTCRYVRHPPSGINLGHLPHMTSTSLIDNNDRPETMTAFLNLLRDKYGGAEMYARQYMQLEEGDVAVIRKNLVKDE